MLQKLAGLVLVFIGAIILTLQAQLGVDANVLGVFGGMVLSLFGASVNVLADDD